MTLLNCKILRRVPTPRNLPFRTVEGRVTLLTDLINMVSYPWGTLTPTRNTQVHQGVGSSGKGLGGGEQVNLDITPKHSNECIGSSSKRLGGAGEDKLAITPKHSSECIGPSTKNLGGLRVPQGQVRGTHLSSPPHPGSNELLGRKVKDVADDGQRASTSTTVTPRSTELLRNAVETHHEQLGRNQNALGEEIDVEDNTSGPWVTIKPVMVCK